MAQGRVRGRKTTLLATAAITPLLCGALTGAAAHAQLNTITGSGSTAGINSGFGGVIGQGSTFGIAQAGAGSNNLTLTLNRGAGGLNDIAVLYIATGLLLGLHRAPASTRPPASMTTPTVPAPRFRPAA